MKETSLKQLSDRIKKAQAVASQDPGTEPQTRRMRLGKINQAKEELRELKLDYRKQLLARAVFAIVTGPGAEKFATVAEEKYNCFSVNADDFYTDLTSKVPPVLYENKVVSGNLLDHLGSSLEDKARTLDIVSYPALILESKHKKNLKDSKDLLQLTKTLINEKVGSEIVALDAMDKISDKVLNSELSGKTIPVVLYTEDHELAEGLAKGLKRSLTRNTYIISTGEEIPQKVKDISLDTLDKVTAKSVEKSLLKLKQSLV